MAQVISYKNGLFIISIEPVMFIVSVRLHRRYSNSTGIVIFKNATLSAPVSGEGFDDKAASVVCRQLGFEKGGISLSFNPFDYFTYRVYSFSNMTCNGDEANLMDCEHNGTYLRYSSKPAVVKCTTGKEEGERSRSCTLIKSHLYFRV